MYLQSYCQRFFTSPSRLCHSFYLKKNLVHGHGCSALDLIVQLMFSMNQTMFFQLKWYRDVLIPVSASNTAEDASIYVFQRVHTGSVANSCYNTLYTLSFLNVLVSDWCSISGDTQSPGSGIGIGKWKWCRNISSSVFYFLLD